MRPLTVEETTGHHLDGDAGRDREHRHLPALQDAEGEMAGDEDARDQRRREVAIVESEQFLHGSTILCSRRVAGLSIVCTLLDGQRITSLSTSACFPSPKCSRR